MLANFHTHSTFCDGNNTPEEIVLAAIERGFSAIGISAHGNTPYDLRYCMTDTEGYIECVTALKEKYRGKIQVYLGLEEDAFAPQDRNRFDYIIGSSHYFLVEGNFYPIDSSPEYFARGLEAYNNDKLKLAECYYEKFCAYIKHRRPDIIGHFDLVTKFDESHELLYLNDPEYKKIAESALLEAAKYGCLFEVNTGAMIRGLRTTPYPSKDLLYLLKKQDAGLILSSDSHDIGTLDGYFDEAKQCLRDIGFDHLYTLYNNEFVKYSI